MLECLWPAVLRTVAKPLDAITWRAATEASCDPAGILAMGYDVFAAAVRAELDRWGGRRNHRILEAMWAAEQVPGGVERERPAALERAPCAIRDWRRALDKLDDVEARMLDALDLTEPVATIDGLSAIGAAAILAEAGDPARFDSAHTGTCTPARAPGPTSRAPSPARPRSPVAVAPPCAPPRGGPSGAR